MDLTPITEKNPLTLLHCPNSIYLQMTYSLMYTPGTELGKDLLRSLLPPFVAGDQLETCSWVLTISGFYHLTVNKRKMIKKRKKVYS